MKRKQKIAFEALLVRANNNYPNEVEEQKDDKMVVRPGYEAALLRSLSAIMEASQVEPRFVRYIDFEPANLPLRRKVAANSAAILHRLLNKVKSSENWEATDIKTLQRFIRNLDKQVGMGETARTTRASGLISRDRTSRGRR